MSTHPTVKVLIVDDNDKARARLIDQLRYPDITIVGIAFALLWISMIVSSPPFSGMTRSIMRRS